MRLVETAYVEVATAKAGGEAPPLTGDGELLELRILGVTGAASSDWALLHQGTKVLGGNSGAAGDGSPLPVLLQGRDPRAFRFESGGIGATMYVHLALWARDEEG